MKDFGEEPSHWKQDLLLHSSISHACVCSISTGEVCWWSPKEICATKYEFVLDNRQ